MSSYTIPKISLVTSLTSVSCTSIPDLEGTWELDDSNAFCIEHIDEVSTYYNSTYVETSVLETFCIETTQLTLQISKMKAFNKLKGIIFKTYSYVYEEFPNLSATDHTSNYDWKGKIEILKKGSDYGISLEGDIQDHDLNIEHQLDCTQTTDLQLQCDVSNIIFNDTNLHNLYSDTTIRFEDFLFWKQ